MEKKNLFGHLIVIGISATALVCAAFNMHVSRNLLRSKDS